MEKLVLLETTHKSDKGILTWIIEGFLEVFGNSIMKQVVKRMLNHLHLLLE